ncbi:methyl-accepting chemotaxis protein [Geotalea sp. SG265]|uniref:methyl-accepting chemotaxis protein n=1 Tax=Geotalea sp. SG265 TaxID=2922867 RepID=UPI001FAEACE0|nr:methyl-accepting chemotaxis protein [Geotalea sp. SG265]
MNFIRNAHLKGKLVSSFALVALIAGIAGFIGTSKITMLANEAEEMFIFNTEPLGTFGMVGIAFQKARVNVRGMILDDNPQRAHANAKTITKFYADIDEQLTALEKTLETAEGKKQFALLRNLLKEYGPVREEIVTATLSGDRETALDIMRTQGLSYERKIDEAIKKLFDMKIAMAEQRNKANNSTARNATIEMASFAIAGMVIAILFGLLIARQITAPLMSVVDFARAIAQGDLTHHLQMDRKDETGQLAEAVNVMADRLNRLIAGVADNATQVAAAAGQLTANAEQMATGAEEVAAQTGTVATASEEMAATSTEIAANCSNAAEEARRASETAGKGSEVIRHTVAEMTRIAERVRETAKTVENLGTRSDQIGEIIGTIEDIADQTNLLALNAAIEAARAGEQGRGFAVVADEVRALAERTTKATKEIGVMIKAIQQETEDAVAIMEQGVTEAERGTAEAAESGKALEEILDQVGSVTMQVNQMATAAEQQTATTAEISSNILQITTVVQGTARGAQETAAAARRLTGLSSELQQLIGQFHLA